MMLINGLFLSSDVKYHKDEMKKLNWTFIVIKDLLYFWVRWLLDTALVWLSDGDDIEWEKKIGCVSKREEVELKKSTNTVSDRAAEVCRELGWQREELARQAQGSFLCAAPGRVWESRKSQPSHLWRETGSASFMKATVLSSSPTAVGLDETLFAPVDGLTVERNPLWLRQVWASFWWRTCYWDLR